jgi:hypothetical protein
VGRLDVAGEDQVNICDQMQASPGPGAGNIALGGVMSFLTTRNLIWVRHGALLRRSGSLPNVTEGMRIAAEQRGVKRATYEESLGKGPTTPMGDRGTKILPRPTVAP